MSDVAAIVSDVRARGDVALREWALRLDGVEPARATPGSGLPEEAVLALADNVRRWHEAQRPSDIRLEVRPGVELERRWLPLGSVGIYVPRGLVSTLVMCAVPALVAGVERIVVATPPDGAGLVAAAAQLLGGIDDVWSLGGPPAIAAFAYGTETIQRVDKICGPGSAYVNEAKLLVSRDVALREWALRLDGVEPARAIPGSGLPEAAVLALADNVRRWHEAQRPSDVQLEVRPGVELERRWLPLGSVGIYVPRGLVSTLVMCAVPALVAGVDRIVVATPPDGAGLVAAAAQLLGVDDVWSLGGPPAIAAFAYGTETIPRVDKICGPGSAYVNDAKLLVSRDVAIDLPAGPSEVVVLASNGTDPRIVELELAAQAEHGPDSVCRVVETLAEVEALAPEHLVLLGSEAEALAPQVRNAGAVFVGASSPVAAGDYATGGNHVLPTGGWARSLGGLGLETFLKPVTIQRLTPEGLARVRPVVEALAAAEGMPAHAAAVRR